MGGIDGWMDQDVYHLHLCRRRRQLVRLLHSIPIAQRQLMPAREGDEMVEEDDADFWDPRVRRTA